MDSHFTVTIHDYNGVKQYNVHKIVKKALIYASVFLVSLIVFSLVTIIYLNRSLNEIEIKKDTTQRAYESLKKQHTELRLDIKATKQDLAEKKRELSEISDSLSELESLIGISRDDISSNEKVSVSQITPQQVSTLLQFVPSGYPIEYKGVTSKFGYRIHPTLNKREFHRGLDMKAEMKTPVYATADGIIEYAGYHKKSGFGRLIIIQHNYGFKSYFGHLNKIVIKSGQFIKKGDLIGYTGNSGLSSGPHLHYEIRFINRPLNPTWFIKWNITNYKEIFEKEKKVPWQSLLTATKHIRVLNLTQIQQSSPQEQKLKVK